MHVWLEIVEHDNLAFQQCHQKIIIFDASADILHSCPGAGAKLELHHNHCSLAPPV